MPPCPTPRLFLFFFLCSKNINRGIITLLACQAITTQDWETCTETRMNGELESDRVRAASRRDSNKDNCSAVCWRPALLFPSDYSDSRCRLARSWRNWQDGTGCAAVLLLLSLSLSDEYKEYVAWPAQAIVTRNSCSAGTQLWLWLWNRDSEGSSPMHDMSNKSQIIFGFKRSLLSVQEQALLCSFAVIKWFQMKLSGTKKGICFLLNSHLMTLN